jgi:hypothetical protein
MLQKQCLYVYRLKNVVSKENQADYGKRKPVIIYHNDRHFINMGIYVFRGRGFADACYPIIKLLKMARILSGILLCLILSGILFVIFLKLDIYLIRINYIWDGFGSAMSHKS